MVAGKQKPRFVLKLIALDFASWSFSCYVAAVPSLPVDVVINADEARALLAGSSCFRNSSPCLHCPIRRREEGYYGNVSTVSVYIESNETIEMARN